MGKHYLEAEIYSLLAKEGGIFDFIRKSALDGLWYMDLEKQEHLWFSPRYWQILGYEPGEKPHHPQSFQDVVHPDDLEPVMAKIHAHCEDASVPYDTYVRFVHKNGSIVWVQCRGMAVRDENGKARRMLGVHQDITALVAARRDAEDASVAKSEFLANMSHEIRTPMHGVLGMADLLLDDDLTGRQRTRLNTLKSSAEHLLSVLNEILDFSKIESGEMQLELIPVHAITLLEHTVAAYNASAAQKGLDLRLSIDPQMPAEIKTDPTKIRQILSNLINNAIKFTAQGAIEVSARFHDDARELVVCVADTGRGIEPERQTSIFEAFKQADNSIARQYGGTGLGLAIVRRLVALLKGQMGLESEPGEGTTFSLRIPVEVLATTQQDDTAGPSTGDATQQTLDSPAVLLVDDAEIGLVVGEDYLTTMGCRVTTAATGNQAIDAFRKTAFAIVFMDCQMPELDGYETTKAIRGIEQQQDRPRTPVIALTAGVTQESHQRAKLAGMDGLLIKPFSRHQLWETLCRYAPTQQEGAGASLEEKFGDLFRSASQKALTRLLTSTANLDRDAMASDAHTLRGALGTLANADILDLVSAIEQKAPTGDAAGLRADIVRLEAMLASVL